MEANLDCWTRVESQVFSLSFLLYGNEEWSRPGKQTERRKKPAKFCKKREKKENSKGRREIKSRIVE